MVVFTDIDVLSADVNIGDEEPHPAKWEIRYSDPTSEGFRYASAWFHTAGEGIQVSVFLAAFLQEPGVGAPRPKISSALTDSPYALEHLYARARSTARILVALTEAELEIPEAMPQPDIQALPFIEADNPL